MPMFMSKDAEESVTRREGEWKSMEEWDSVTRLESRGEDRSRDEYDVGHGGSRDERLGGREEVGSASRLKGWG